MNRSQQTNFLNIKSKILLVDDNPVMRELGKECLLLNDYQVALACNGKEALEEMSKNKYDLILLDIQMPILDGFETIKRLNQWKKRPPVIALTAKSSRTDISECFQAGFDDVLTKPYNVTEYSEIIKKHLKEIQFKNNI
jgi:two-component system KDP operon response regulator KdpE